MPLRLDWEKEGKRKLVKARGAESIAPGERTLTPGGYLRPNKKTAKKDPRPRMDVSPIVFKQEDVDSAREAILRTEREKEERKRAKSVAAAEARKAARAKRAKEKGAANRPHHEGNAATFPATILQQMARGRTREVAMEVKEQPHASRRKP